MLQRLAPLALVLALGAFAAPAQAAEVTWFGHAAYKIVTPEGKVLLIDPYITGNPTTPEAMKSLDALGPVDLILVTHGHGDHLGDAAAIAAKTGAKVAVNADMGSTLQALGIIPKESLIRFNRSGSIAPVEGVVVTMVHAEHGSTIMHNDQVHPGGDPVGFIIELSDGLTLYHAGDTGIFSDMTLIGAYYQPEVVFLPIGGHFTMDPAHAAYAVRELLKPETVVPMHYGTNPMIKGTPVELEAALGDWPGELVVMQPGETRTF
jgi:L-ascorbate metabolism protein UlaG (beta-lactamase superfamily)